MNQEDHYDSDSARGRRLCEHIHGDVMHLRERLAGLEARFGGFAERVEDIETRVYRALEIQSGKMDDMFKILIDNQRKLEQTKWIGLGVAFTAVFFLGLAAVDGDLLALLRGFMKATG